MVVSHGKKTQYSRLPYAHSKRKNDIKDRDDHPIVIMG